MLVILGRLSKCITRAEILQFGKRHLKRLQAKELFPYGLPSEATFCRVFQSIDDEKMADRMSAFADVFRKEISASATDIICIDGKAMRGTLYDNRRNPDIVSAYSLRSGFTLATDVCKEKSNEIKSVPRLLDKLDVSGCVVTAIKIATPTDIYKEGPYLEHDRIESRVCHIYREEELIAVWKNRRKKISDKQKGTAQIINQSRLSLLISSLYQNYCYLCSSNQNMNKR